MLERAEMIPAADLDGARKPALLIVAIDAFDHQQRIVVELEVETVIVAALRIGIGARRRGIAVIDADHQRHLSFGLMATRTPGVARG